VNERADGRPPLAGRRVAVTRPAAQAAALAAALEERGATVVRCPLIRIEPVGDEAQLRSVAARIAEYDVVVFTSVNAVERLATALSGAPAPHTLVAAVGTATADAAAAAGLAPRLVPETATAEALATALAAGVELRGKRILFPRARAARRVLPRRLRALGAVVDEVECYRSAADPVGAARLAARVAAGELDAIAVSSPSQVAVLAGALAAPLPAGLVVAAIGPVTASALRERGFEPAVVAAAHNAAGLVDALTTYFAGLAARSAGSVDAAPAPERRRGRRR
jgi:uroporphyrinogen-III synthase